MQQREARDDTHDWFWLRKWREILTQSLSAGMQNESNVNSFRYSSENRSIMKASSNRGLFYDEAAASTPLMYKSSALISETSARHGTEIS